MEPGDYRARAVKVQLGKAKSGNEQIGVEFELLDFNGKRMGWYGSFSEAAFEITMKGLATAGFHGADVSDTTWVEHAPEVILVIVNEEWEGKVRAKVKFINSLGGVNMKDAITGSDAKTFAARMKGRVLAYQSSAGAPKTQKPNGGQRSSAPAGGGFDQPPLSDEPPPGFDDGGSNDIPF
jgi:hypothetical protein